MTDPVESDSKDQDITAGTATPEAPAPLWALVFKALLAIAFLVVLALMLNMAWDWPRSVRRAPTIVLIPAVPIALWVAVEEVRNLVAGLQRRRQGAGHTATGAGEPAGDGPLAPGRKELMPFVWLGVFTALVLTLGALLGSAAFALLFLKLRGESWLLTIVYSAALPLTLWFIFRNVLGVAVYRGWLGIL